MCRAGGQKEWTGAERHAFEWVGEGVSLAGPDDLRAGS